MHLPIALAKATFLGTFGIIFGISSFGEVARKMLFGAGGAIGQADVVTAVLLVRASHWTGVSVLGIPKWWHAVYEASLGVVQQWVIATTNLQRTCSTNVG